MKSEYVTDRLSRNVGKITTAAQKSAVLIYFVAEACSHLSCREFSLEDLSVVKNKFLLWN